MEIPGIVCPQGADFCVHFLQAEVLYVFNTHSYILNFLNEKVTCILSVQMILKCQEVLFNCGYLV